MLKEGRGIDDSQVSGWMDNVLFPASGNIEGGQSMFEALRTCVNLVLWCTSTVCHQSRLPEMSGIDRSGVQGSLWHHLRSQT